MEKFENLQPNQIFWSACIKKKDHLVKKYLRYERPKVDVIVVDGAATV